MVLARLRQLAATKSATRSASPTTITTAAAASRDDYPHPLETRRRTHDRSTDAYAVASVMWDKVAVRYAYGDAAPRRTILAEAAARDLRFLSDQDPPYHPRVDRWANGTDPAAERAHDARRRAALDRFARRPSAAARRWR